MKAAWSMLAGLALVLALVAGLQADDKDKKEGKEVTLKGTMVCGKCTLKETDKCTNVLQVKEKDKTVNYYIKDDGNKASYHKGICPAGKKAEATVTGTVSEKDGKKWVTASKVETK
jgi:hypothetical protein